MPTSYTSLLGMALPVTGELSGTWGDTVNDYITKYVDAAVAGVQTISGSQTAVTLSTTNGGTLTSAGSGATGSAQYAIINCTGNPAGLLTVTAPAASKVYLVLNNTSTSQSVKVVGAGPTTGVTVATAQAALIAWNGSDFELVATTDISKLTGVLTVANGGTGASTLTANNVILGNGTSAVQFVAPGTNGNILTSNGTTWVSSAAPATGVTSFSAGTTGFTPSTGTTGAVTLAGTLAVANGGTGQTTYTDGQLLIGNTTGNTLAKSTLTAGTGISITNGSGSITIATSGGGAVNIGLVRAIAINCILP